MSFKVITAIKDTITHATYYGPGAFTFPPMSKERAGLSEVFLALPTFKRNAYWCTLRLLSSFSGFLLLFGVFPFALLVATMCYK